MDAVLQLGYDAAGLVARALAALAPPGDAKFLQALRARRGIRTRYADWAVSARDRARPLLWMHAPSVGEGLQARPVLQLARKQRPDVQLAYTFFSPSASAFARGLDVDFSDYLPFDTEGEAGAALDALSPRALVFSKLDVWPRLTREASARRVALGLVSATLAEGSSRRRGIAARLLADAYARLDAVGAIDARDAERLVTLGVRGDRITVTGDTRYDQVWARVRAADRSTGLLAALASDRPTLVAGSTWPADEGPLLAAWTRVRATLPDVRLIIAPHEPDGVPPNADRAMGVRRRPAQRSTRRGRSRARRRRDRRSRRRARGSLRAREHCIRRWGVSCGGASLGAGAGGVRGAGAFRTEILQQPGCGLTDRAERWRIRGERDVRSRRGCVTGSPTSARGAMPVPRRARSRVSEGSARPSGRGRWSRAFLDRVRPERPLD